MTETNDTVIATMTTTTTTVRYNVMSSCLALSVDHRPVQNDGYHNRVVRRLGAPSPHIARIAAHHTL